MEDRDEVVDLDFIGVVGGGRRRRPWCIDDSEKVLYDGFMDGFSGEDPCSFKIVDDGDERVDFP